MATIDRRFAWRLGWRYRARVRVRGRLVSATFPSLRTARRWAIAQEAAVQAETALPEAARHTLGDVVERYTREVLSRKRASTARVQGVYLAWWQEHVGHLPLAEVTPAHLVACRERLARTRAQATVRGYLATLGHALAVAVREWQWLEASPLTHVQKPACGRGRVRFLSPDELPRLLAACQASSNPYLYLVVVLALATAARKMELLGSHWGQVDLSRAVMRLEHTKNGDRRTLYLSGQALDLLRAHAKVRRLDTALLFPRADGKQPSDIRYAFQQALRAAEIADFRFHDLRHTAASYLAMGGATARELADVLGHRSLGQIMRYAHLSEGHMRGLMERLSASLFG